MRHCAGRAERTQPIRLDVSTLSPCERLPDDLLLRVLEHMLRRDGAGVALKSWCGAVRRVNRRWRAVHDAACTSVRVRDGATDEDMHVLCGRLPALTWLSLGGVKSLTAAGLRAVGGLTALTYLDLFSCANVTNAVLRELRGLTVLSHLILYGCTDLTNLGLRELRGLTALTRLSLTDCSSVTSTGLQHLTPLTSLTTLYLIGTSTTQEGRASLKAALPALNIVFYE
jgi:hypothetical protein